MNLHPERLRWNRKYSDPGFTPDWAPEVILAERLKQFPKGRALDVACGIGANALFLAKRGYRVDALDLSDVALERLRLASATEGVQDQIELILADAEAYDFPVAAYDLVLCFRFLSRRAAPRLEAALAPGGVLLFRTWTQAYRAVRPEFPEDFLLAPGELESLFPALETLHYAESGPDGAYEATLIARRSE